MEVGIKAILLGSILSVLSQSAMAQMNNKPFQFKNSAHGIGMSQGGKQAIINESLFGSTPDNLLRSRNGELLSVEEGRGKSAIVRFDGTNTIIPGYRGSTFGSDNDAMRVGVFNAFFTTDSGRSSSYSSNAALTSYHAVSTWTRRVAADGTYMEHIYVGAGHDTVDAWTGQVLTLPVY